MSDIDLGNILELSRIPADSVVVHLWLPVEMQKFRTLIVRLAE